MFELKPIEIFGVLFEKSSSMWNDRLHIWSTVDTVEQINDDLYRFQELHERMVNALPEKCKQLYDTTICDMSFRIRAESHSYRNLRSRNTHRNYTVTFEWDRNTSLRETGEFFWFYGVLQTLRESARQIGTTS